MQSLKQTLVQCNPKGAAITMGGGGGVRWGVQNVVLDLLRQKV